MNDCLDDMLSDWNIDGAAEPSEAERAYLFNDVGLLRHLIDIGNWQGSESLEDLLPDA